MAEFSYEMGWSSLLRIFLMQLIFFLFLKMIDKNKVSDYNIKYENGSTIEKGGLLWLR